MSNSAVLWRRWVARINNKNKPSFYPAPITPQIIQVASPPRKRGRKINIKHTNTHTHTHTHTHNYPSDYEPDKKRKRKKPNPLPTPVHGTTTLVPYNSLVTVATYMVPTSFKFQCTGFIASGDVNAYFQLVINGKIIAAGRSTVASQTVELNFNTAKVKEGGTIQLQVMHFASGIQGNFEGTILGNRFDFTKFGGT